MHPTNRAIESAFPLPKIVFASQARVVAILPRLVVSVALAATEPNDVDALFEAFTRVLALDGRVGIHLLIDREADPPGERARVLIRDFMAKVGARSSASLGVCVEGGGFRASAKRAAALLAGVRVRGVTLKTASTNAECASWVVSQVDARLPAAHLAATAERLRAELQAGTLRSGEWIAVRG